MTEYGEVKGEERILAQALERFDFAMSAEDDQRRKAIEDLRFAHVEESQWDEYTKHSRAQRPKYEINKIKSMIGQVVNEARQNQISIKVRPRSSGASIEIADIYNGLIRDIENESKFSFVKNVAAEEAFTGGFGAWQVITEYQDEESFDGSQNIKIIPIHSATTSVFFDPSSTDEFHRDAEYCFVCENISKNEFKARYPDFQPTGVDSKGRFGWATMQDRDTVLVADYWCKKPYKKKIGLLTSGKIVEIDKEFEKVIDELAANGEFVEEEKTVDSYRVQHYKISGESILEGPNNWAGTNIPVVPVYGHSMWIDGSHYYHGLVRFAKDAQRILNYTTSSKIEQTALNPARRLATPRQIVGHETSWESSDPRDPLLYNPDPMVPGGAPVLLTNTPMNNALIEQTYQADADLQDTMGVYKQSLGDNPRNQSGRALLAQQNKADIGVFGMRDNLGRAVERTGEILVDLIPSIYDNERQIRILSEDGEPIETFINQTVTDEQTGKQIQVNDLSVGRYDVISSVGPSYQTQRQETMEQMAFIVQTNPDLAPFALPVMLENSDSASARAMGEALRMDLVRAGKLEPNAKEKKKLEEEAQAKAQAGPSPEEIAIQNELKLKEAEARLKAAEAMKAEMQVNLETQRIQIELQKMQSEIEKNEAQADKLERDAREPYRKEGLSK